MDDQRIDRLLEAVLSVAADLDLERILARIVSAACDLVDARYAALGVIDEDGEALSAFVHHGVSEPVVRAIGHLPRGQGILGLLIEQPTPIRLDDLTQHPSSFGFPPNHPPMHAFLGTPIRVREQVFGNLYLTEKRDGGAFTEEDEDLVVGLAAVAGAAIANARLLGEARRRESWRTAVLEIAEAVLGGSPIGEVRQQVTALGAGLLDASSATLVERYEEGLWVLATVGDGPDPGFLAITETPARTTLEQGEPVRAPHGPIFDRASLWAPVHADGRVVAAIGVGREEPFTAAEEQLLVAFGTQVAFAWSFERAQREVQSLRLIEDRERIGRDLHDTVIQRLFATGLSLQASIRRCDGVPEVAERLERAVDEIDETVREIRSTIFALQSAGQTARGIRSRLLEIVDEVGGPLPRSPRVRFDGPVDAVVSPAIAEHLLPVTREALTNVVKHARATDVEVELRVDQQQLELRVVDDGVGLPADTAPGGFGLGNLQERAARLGGALELSVGRSGRGTAVRLTVPLSSP